PWRARHTTIRRAALGTPRPDASALRWARRPSRSRVAMRKAQNERPAPTEDERPVARRPGARRSGTVAIVGRPNVGKSTLMNAALEQALTIVSATPQTTRESILGVVRRGEAEIALLDTPGLHRAKTALG